MHLKMEFKKDFWTFFALICNLAVLTDGLSRFKLMYSPAERKNFPAEHLPDIHYSIIDRAVDVAKRELENEAKFDSIHYSQSNSRRNRQVKDEVWTIHKHAAIGARAVDILSSTQNLTREASDGLVKRAPPRSGINFNVLCANRRFQCNRDAKFRLLDGSCNNLINPGWGMAVHKQNRLLAPKYADGLNTPRAAANGRPLPLSRFVRTTTIPDISAEHELITHMFVQYGQFLNHDMVSTPDRTDLSNCCNNRNTVDCLPLMIPRDDPDLSQLQIGCMEFARSIRACGNGVRQQINQNTAFIDGSQVYGSSDTESSNLRTFRQGLLQSSNNGLNLPVNPNDASCTTQGTGTNFCFRAGDGRLNIQPGLSSVHTLFMREHNRIARILLQMAPRFNDQTLFQEAKRVLIAELESIAYNEYLPIILGPDLMTKLKLKLPVDGKATTYKSDVDPGIINSFSTAAFRFAHSMIHNFGQLGNSRSAFALKDNYNNPTVVHRAGADSVLTGSVAQKAEAMDNFMVEGVTKFLFKQGNNPVGLDLGAFNIERGREHGIPSYNDFREFCELPRLKSFRELANVFKDSGRAADAFQEAYENVDDIDLFVGGIAEKAVRGGVVGPTFACIIGIQFHRLLYGDRHFFTHGNQPGSFTADERAMLSKRTLASVMCDNMSLDSIQLNAFLAPNSTNRVVSCAQHPKIDFNIFF